MRGLHGCRRRLGAAAACEFGGIHQRHSHGVFRSNVHRKGQPLAAGLSSSSQGGIHTLMFVSEVKLDLSSIAIVADACVLPLTHSIMPLITTGLRKITNLQQIVTLEDEVTAWKQLLPALAMRCELLIHFEGDSGVRRYEGSPLCGCGHGKNLGPFSQTSA